MEGSKIKVSTNRRKKAVNTIDIAKEIFMKYGGSHFFMAREGKYELYKSFNISNEQESLWIKEYQKKLLCQLQDEDVASDIRHLLVDLCQSIIEYKDIECLTELLAVIKSKKDSVDSFTQIRMAESLLGIVESFTKRNLENHHVIQKSKKFALNILKNIFKKPITVGSSYINLGYLQDEIKEYNIKKRVNSEIRRWDKN